MKAWTYFKNAFTLGGYSYTAKGFEFTDKERIELGKGYYGYVLQSPQGKTIVVEERSGAIIGSSVEEVRKDIEEGDVEYMEKQVQRACQEDVEIIPESEFWANY